MPKSDPRKARDWMVEDACESAKARGKIPVAEDASRYIQSVMANLDRRQSETVNKAPVKTSKKPGAFEAEVKKRTVQAGFELVDGWEVTAKERPLALGGGMFTTKHMNWGEKCLRERIRLIASKPDWAKKLKRINPLVLQGQFGPDKKREAENEVRKVIDASNAVFGHWLRPLPTAKPFSYAKQDKR